MSRRRAVVATVIVVFLQVFLLSPPDLRGAAPLPVPAFVVWTGLAAGAARGAGTGLLAGGLLFLLGGSPWEMGFLSLAGGAAGTAFPQQEGFWRSCLLSLPLLAGWELLHLAALWCGGGDALAALPLLGREWLLCAAALPLVGLLCRCLHRDRFVCGRLFARRRAHH